MVLGYKIQLYTGKHLYALSYFVMGFGRDGGIWEIWKGWRECAEHLDNRLTKVTELPHVSDVSQDLSADPSPLNASSRLIVIRKLII